ncbi:MAG: L,D-transpeptidase family protein [Byssovorax sp.]
MAAGSSSGAMSLYIRVAGLATLVACATVHVDRVAYAAAEEPGIATEAASIRGYLESQGSPVFVGDARDARLWKALQAFYWSRAYAPAWIRDGRLTPGAAALLRTAATVDREGLSAERYDPRVIAGGTLPARVDVAVTYVFLRLAADLGLGVTDPRGSTVLWRLLTRDVDFAALLAEAARRDAPADVLAAVRPAHPQYRALVDALARHRRIAQAGGWPTVPEKARGNSAAQAAALRARLLASGDLEDGGRMKDALARFQSRHGLAAKGVLDAATLAALNVPVEDRIQQIELNLERWRWQGFPASGRTILVNVPTFELHAYEDGREEVAMRVITGKGDSPTPVFDEGMTQVIFSPHWNVPANILETEVLPAIKKNPRYLASKNMEMVRSSSGEVAVRQRPGPNNALGLVKFLLPNPFNVYLHDTPGDALFTRAERAFSHGCIRLEKPEALARFALRGTSWDDAAIARAMRSGQEQFVALEKAIPVAVTYFTAWVDADGTVRFAPDVYRHDVAQRKLVPVPKTATFLALVRS